MQKGRVTYAHTVRDGDTVMLDGYGQRVHWVKRAQGRKPPRGENLHLGLGDGGYITVNSVEPIRVLRRAGP